MVYTTQTEKDWDAKPELRVGGQTCECAGCGLFFTGVKPFDRHQLDDDNGVICRTETQMLAIGMVANKHGVWSYGIPKKIAEAA